MKFSKCASFDFIKAIFRTVGFHPFWTHWNAHKTFQLLNEPTIFLSIFFFFRFCSNDSAGHKLLKQLSKINRPLEIQFKDMLNLMNQCDIVERQNLKRNERSNVHPSKEDTSKSFQFKNNPFSVFSGIIPGTKWCGTGDIATSYNDIGEWFPLLLFLLLRLLLLLCLSLSSFQCDGRKYFAMIIESISESTKK